MHMKHNTTPTHEPLQGVPHGTNTQAEPLVSRLHTPHPLQCGPEWVRLVREGLGPWGYFIHIPYSNIIFGSERPASLATRSGVALGQACMRHVIVRGTSLTQQL